MRMLKQDYRPIKQSKSVSWRIIRLVPNEIQISVLDVQYIESALPELSGNDFDNLSKSTNITFCGDNTYHGSVEGALLSAQRAIDNILKKRP